tara:strand:+ start:114 stop:293 length:180 start_codon:yes stop_codon:yes gene_type:complete
VELIDFQNKKWRVVGKVEGNRIDDHTKLKKQWGCDLVLKNNKNIFYMLQEVIDVEFEDI